MIYHPIYLCVMSFNENEILMKLPLIRRLLHGAFSVNYS
jgi:hypothetical protein